MALPPNTPAPPISDELVSYLINLAGTNFHERGPYEVLRIARAAERTLREYETEVANAAVAAGASWTDLGRELGMTRQGAQRRYAEGQQA